MEAVPVRSPQDLRKLSLKQLQDLSEDIRQKILSTCLKNGGHLGASLGAVELAIALHFVFDSPFEPIVWDVGHQAYAHKLLTGRWDQFETLRCSGGISGFLSRAESPHDIFGAGHSSTALSAALAIAWSKGRESNINDFPPWTVAVVGDGGLTAGIAFEALNNVRNLDLGPLLLVVNDNQMSISSNVGAISSILMEHGEQTRGFFESFGLDYRGPIHGHELGILLEELSRIRQGTPEKPVVLHVLTQKGRGYTPAEESPARFHGVSPVQNKPMLPKVRTFSDVFGEMLCELAEKDSRIVAITAAMPEGTGLVEFSRRFPDRFFDVGIAEPHAVTFAAGLATEGFRPVVAIYSTFLQRAFDSIIHDVALQRLGVTFAIDRAGIVGPDGPTHHGAFDLAYLSAVPGLRLSAPSCLADIRNILTEAVGSESPWAIRYPRGGGRESFEVNLDVEGIRTHACPERPEAVVVAVGTAAPRVLEAVNALSSCGHAIAAFSVVHVKPIPKNLIDYLRPHPDVPLMIVEDGCIQGGFGQALLSKLGPRVGVVELAGYGDHFIPHGATSELEEHEKISSGALTARLEALLKSSAK